MATDHLNIAITAPAPMRRSHSPGQSYQFFLSDPPSVDISRILPDHSTKLDDIWDALTIAAKNRGTVETVRLYGFDFRNASQWHRMGRFRHYFNSAIEISHSNPRIRLYGCIWNGESHEASLLMWLANHWGQFVSSRTANGTTRMFHPPGRLP